MKKNISNKLAVALCLLALFSCKSKKHLLADRSAADTVLAVDSTKPVAATTSAATASTSAPATPIAPVKPPVDNLKLQKLKAIRSKQVDFNTFLGKAQTKLNVNGDTHDVTLNIRIKKGEQIWISVTAILGVEAARALITPDSIKIMNRLESTYLKRPFSYVYGYTSKQINYKTLESLLTGNAITELVNDDAVMKADNGNIILSGNLQDLLYDLIIGPDLRVSRTDMSNQIARRSIHVTNADFIQVGAKVVPSRVSINSSVGAKNFQADLHYNKVEFDQSLSFPFSVPSRFTLVN